MTMKKLFFTVLVAIVAIGGAVAGNSTIVTTLPAGSLYAVPCQDTVENCTVNSYSRIVCTNIMGDQLFTTDPLTGNCEIMLFRQIEPE